MNVLDEIREIQSLRQGKAMLCRDQMTPHILPTATLFSLAYLLVASVSATAITISTEVTNSAISLLYFFVFSLLFFLFFRRKTNFYVFTESCQNPPICSSCKQGSLVYIHCFPLCYFVFSRGVGRPRQNVCTFYPPCEKEELVRKKKRKFVVSFHYCSTTRTATLSFYLF